ncbi:MAG: SRPBCC family protein [Acidimicrobiia bacterium]|nr:SRPBCC family protein [Acidimicrobiia bacterium]
MIEVRVNIEVDLPPEEVFEFWSDHSNNPTWQRGMISCTWTSEPPIGVGSTYDQVASFLGRQIVSTFECVEHEPGAMIRMRTTKSTLPLDITRKVAPTPSGGTALSAIIRGEPQGVMKLFNPLTRRMVERNVNQDYERLKELLDERAAAGTTPP